MSPPSPVVHLADLALEEQRHGESFAAGLASLTAGTGARHLGARLAVVPPGKRAWPYHCHHANDELFVILAGEGTLRLGDVAHPFRAGDVLVCPAGGAATAHAITNTGEAALSYLAVSSMREPDVMEYPDSGKWGAFAGAAPGGPKGERSFAAFVTTDARRGYWDGEDRRTARAVVFARSRP